MQLVFSFRKLVAVAHERELSRALEALSAQFDRWRTGEIDAFDLNEEIHKHHQGVSKDLYTLHVRGQPSQLVAHALVSGVLDEKEVDEQYLPLLDSMIEFFRQQS